MQRPEADFSASVKSIGRVRRCGCADVALLPGKQRDAVRGAVREPVVSLEHRHHRPRRPGGPGAVALLYLCMEIAGCPTVCRHCWAQGSRYGMMPLTDIEWALQEAHRFCDGAGVGFDAYPMHEVAAHADAARLFGLFNSHSGTVRGCADGRAGTMFEPLTTTGVPLAARDDWREVLRAAAGTGTLNLWTAFHGAGEVHDRQAGRRGAFAETCRGVERARAAGVSVGCNVFLTTASLPQLDELASLLPPLGVHAMSIETASFLPTPRSRANERLRPAPPRPAAGRRPDRRPDSTS